jgi:RND family efflux transporter MFP subunit
MKTKPGLIIIRIVVSIALLAGLVLGGRRLILRKRAALAKAPKFEMKARPVETIAAVRGNLRESHDYLAVIEPVQTTNVSPQVTAVVKRVLHQEGDVVKKGEVLATLEDRQISDGIAIVQAQIEQARAEDAANQATLESLRKTSAYWRNEMTRDADLARKETISQAEAQASAEKYNEARGRERNADQRSLVIKQQVLALQRKIDELKTTQTYYTLKSPFDGVVSGKFADNGDLAVPGKALFTVEDRSAIKLSFDVPQTDLPAIKEGLAATFTFNRQEYQTAISRIYPTLNRARMLRAEATLAPADVANLSLGAYVTLSVAFSTHQNAILVPLGALIENGQSDTHLFRVENGVLQRRPIKVLGTACDTAAVEGVQPGDRIVVNSFLGWTRLSTGMKVETN